MRVLLILACIGLPTLCSAKDRFGAWVEKELGFVPFHTQSIGWDAPEAAVTVADPQMTDDGKIFLFDIPNSTGWVVGILDDADAARLTGLALVWSDGIVDRAVSHGFAKTDSGHISFQTPRQLWEGDALPAAFLTQLEALTPGPRLVEHPDGTLFPAGDSNVRGACYETIALYKDDDALIGLVVLFQSSTRTDPDAAVCAPLTT